MTQIHWLNDVGGSFTNPANWSGGAVPRSADDAILDPAGVTPFTVTLTANAEVNSLQTAADATLAITGKLFRAVNGTGAGVNAGTISVGGRSEFRVDGVFDNAGAIQLHRLMTTGPGAGALTLTGGGVVTEYTPNGVAAHGRITGGDLTNVDNTIEGGSATAERGLYIQLAGTLTNGVSGILSSDSIETIRSGGHVRASSIDNYGQIDNTGALYIRTGALTNGGTILNNSAASILGNYGMFINAALFDNKGVVETGAARATLAIGSQSFVNSGTIENPGSGFIRIDPATAASTLTNAGLVLNAGSGEIALGEAFATGVIDNTGTIVASDGLIVLYPAHASATALTNTGTILASGGRIIVESGLDNAGGVVVAGGTINIEDNLSGRSATISAGTLSFFAGSADVRFDGSGGELFVYDPQTFTGSIYGFLSTGGTSLDFGSVLYTGGQQASFSGDASGGTLTVTDGTRTASMHLVGDYLSTTFVTSRGQDSSVLVSASSGGASAFVAAMAGIGGGNGVGAMAHAPARSDAATSHGLALPDGWRSSAA